MVQEKCTVDWEEEDPHRALFGAQCVEDVGDIVWLRNCIGVEVVMWRLRKRCGLTARLGLEHELASSVAVEENLHTAHLANQMVDVAQDVGAVVWLVSDDMLPVRTVEWVVFDVSAEGSRKE